MRIYNYLFYNSYLLAKKSRNFEDIPVLGGIPFVALCIILNISSLLILIACIFNASMEFIHFMMKYKYLFGLGLVLLLLFYYSRKNKYKKIIEYYDSKEGNTWRLHPIVVIFFYYAISGLLLLLAALYKNQDWIFAK